MGILSRLTGAASKSDIEAQYAPQVLGEYSPYAMPFQFAYVGRTEAMGVPALARCRNLLAGTIGTIPLELYKKILIAIIHLIRIVIIILVFVF